MEVDIQRAAGEVGLCLDLELTREKWAGDEAF